MEDMLTLPVSYRDTEYNFPFRIIPQGYTYRFVVTVDELEVIFERDDSGELRALTVDSSITDRMRLPEPGLLAAIAAVIDSLMQ